MSETVHSNAVTIDSDLALSVVTPFHKNDPALLISLLASQGAGLPIELIVVDDGSGDDALTTQIIAAIDAFPTPATLVTFTQNQGRSAARNRLIRAARAPYILFLDSDMAPDESTFLRDWLALIGKAQPTIAYGGFTTLQVPRLPELELARALAERGDCQTARQRVQRGALAVATSNLLVRADIMREVTFDAGFSGWGWEDIDWALRAADAGYAISHVPIPATHMGLDVPEVLLEKFAKAGPNFRRIVARHPQMQITPGTRLARLLANVPAQKPIRSSLAWIAKNDAMPMVWRSRAARIWRAIWAS
jgi:glycosyltransferase involved in cell wall biosynthesis